MIPPTFFIQNTNELLDMVYELQSISVEINDDLDSLVSKIVQKVEKIVDDLEDRHE